MERRVGIIGAGISGLLACKYILEKGFQPLVFEAEDGIGGLWRHTIESTKLQNSKESYRFSDLAWDSCVEDEYPSNVQVMEYLNSYAHHFGLFPYIRFNSRVIDIDYVGDDDEQVMEAWDLWGGNGRPFASKGKWHICKTLRLSPLSGVPNMPEFPEGQGPEVFKGQVLHSMEYSSMANEDAAEFIKAKRVTVVGSQKSAFDIAVECANANGIENPCTMIQRTTHWLLPDTTVWGISLGFLYFNRFSEFLVHKPGESFLLSLVATLLSPLRWAISKFVESNLRWKLPLDKYGLVPNHSFLQDVSSCQIGMLPQQFYERVEEGSIIIKRSQGFRFCKEGLIIDGESNPIETDVVILATGYKGDQKLRNIFKSPIFQKYFNIGSATSKVPLYRQILHARIPQLAIIGYGEGLSNLFFSEMECQWLARFLEGGIELPNVREMEKNVKMWEANMKLYGGKYYWKSCIGGCSIWYNDQLCQDMGCKPTRKNGLFAEMTLLKNFVEE
ncbi:putative flavin-containing monooxygenase 1 [Senna tora]|uniref:Flavin-containing monooxygenase n=1 Tax=Senna tora TaxID=362788 RepID=A0A834SLZ6_9FABA|nr:putative flavin-containing monooxygenase 1 [Senna tora]